MPNRSCAFCGADISTRAARARFCSDTCRAKYSKAGRDPGRAMQLRQDSFRCSYRDDAGRCLSGLARGDTLCVITYDGRRRTLCRSHAAQLQTRKPQLDWITPDFYQGYQHIFYDGLTGPELARVEYAAWQWKTREFGTWENQLCAYLDGDPDAEYPDGY